MNLQAPSTTDSRARPEPFTFYPPNSNRLVTWLVQRQQSVRKYYDELWQLLQFVALHDGYVGESMTFERFLDVLCLLEMEVCKERKIWGPRKARVKVGKPIDLKDHAAAYAADKRGTLQHITVSLESSVREMLEQLEMGCRSVVDSAAVVPCPQDSEIGR